MPALPGRSFAAIPQPASSSCSVAGSGQCPADGGLHLRPLRPHSRAPQRPPPLPLSSNHGALPLPSPRGSPINYLSTRTAASLGFQQLYQHNIEKDRRGTKFILGELVYFQITSTLSNFFNCGSVRSTESTKINCQIRPLSPLFATCMSVCGALCACVFVYLCVCVFVCMRIEQPVCL